MEQRTTACAHCGVWRCDRCGWRRYRANRSYAHHRCRKCNSTKGTMLEVFHRRPDRCEPEEEE